MTEERMKNVDTEDRVAAQPAEQGRRRWALWGGVAMVVVLLVGAAGVGGWLVARRRVPPHSGVVTMSRAAELPKEMPVAVGPVQEVKGKVITLEIPTGGHGVVYSDGSGVTKKEGEWKQIQVVVTQDTKIYAGVPLSPQEIQKGGEFQSKVEEATLADIKVGDHIEVWGKESGQRITAEVIHINRRFPRQRQP